MAIAMPSKLESEVTPPSTPGSRTETELNSQQQQTTVELASSKTCASKNCIHKKKDEDDGSKDKTSKKQTEGADSNDSDSESSDSSSDESEADSSDSEEDKKGKKSNTKTKKAAAKSKKKNSKTKKSKKSNSSNSSKDSSDEEDDSEKSDNESVESAGSDDIKIFKKAFKLNDMKKLKSVFKKRAKSTEADSSDSDSEDSDGSGKSKKSKKSKKVATKTKTKEKGKKAKKTKKASKIEYKRLDQIWDEELYDYKLKETSKEKKDDKYDQYIFLVRRRFDDDNHYQDTVVDIKSDSLKQCLQKVMGDCEGVSFVEETPTVEPHQLFLFLEDMRELVTSLKKSRDELKKKKLVKAHNLKIKHLKKMIDYLDEDYEATKKSLYPLLASGKITFDLLWALFRPNQLAYTTTYGDDTHPRAFRIVSAYKNRSMMKGVYYEVEGKYLDFDGKSFGLAESSAEVTAFQGTRKITSLPCYPLKYHSDAESLMPKLVERGKKFLTLGGMNYKNCAGMGFCKKEDKILKANVNGRIMIDPATFRRVNPNYPLNDIEPKHVEVQDEDDECCCEKKEEDRKTRVSKKHYRLVKTEGEEPQVLEISAEEQAEFEAHIDSPEKQKDYMNTFTEEELLTASPVLPGFAFGEKMWLELPVACVSEVSWNVGAFDSLVLPDKQKSIVKALVTAHGLHSKKAVDDVIAGKGKGLVAVLHGKPGLGKTLTCEAVSDLLKRPLYTVSAGDLGTNPCHLENELSTILDIANTWGAILLMDEADVFLEERTINDIHRNALVSIFLRLLEYFQGILFLTTNRVETFDKAFVSRIHLSLQYKDLTNKAKKAVWKTFVERVRNTEGNEIGKITETDYDDLARHDLNGRQIKNLIKTAQALSLYEKKPLSMEHIQKVLDVARSFELDLKGGLGFEDAMRSYT